MWLRFLSSSRRSSRAWSIFGAFIVLFSGATTSFSQSPMSPMGQPGSINASDQNRQLADQVTELREQVAKLQAVVQQAGRGKKVSPKSGMKRNPSNKDMGMMDEKSEMGIPGKSAMPSGSMGMEGNPGEMGGMATGSRNNTSVAPAAAMGMCCMPKAASGGNASMNAMPSDTGGMPTMNGSSSAMPGQAGTSHLYHIGSNGFFLNHSRHITLTPEQKLTLNHLKDKATVDSAYEQRRIAQGEQELYILTGADEPDNARIQSKIVEIEKLRADQRMNFIRAVADASSVLTPEQRKALLGTMAAARK